MIKRDLERNINNRLFKNKAIIVLGARQTGKTTLIKELLKGYEDVLWLNGDENDTVALFDSASSNRFKTIFAGKKIIVVDEAQRIGNIGLKLKLITDQIPNIQLIATGSSAFELSNKVNEPLTGRKWEYQLFPFSYSEMTRHFGILEEKQLLNHRLIYGYYPDVVNNPGDEKEILKQLSDSYLYKDILMWGGLKKPEKLVKLLQALALQLGSEISYNNLASLLELDNETVYKYIQLLESAYIIFKLPALNRNLRKELKRGRKIYFYDNGIRNSLIANFNVPELRNDIGALWENFVVSERQKYLQHKEIWTNRYFWRTSDQQEIDYVEERDGKFFAYEIKWNTKKRPGLSKTFSRAYPDHEYTIINPDNFEEFIVE